jgi:hypothetical protein
VVPFKGGVKRRSLPVTKNTYNLAFSYNVPPGSPVVISRAIAIENKGDIGARLKD